MDTRTPSPPRASASQQDRAAQSPSTANACVAGAETRRGESVHVTGFFRVADIDDDRDLRPCCDLRGTGIRATATYDADSEPSLRGTYPADLEDALLYVAAVEWEAHLNGWGSTAWPDGAWAWVVGPRGQHEAVTERAAWMKEVA
jgi:hypothetical protein